MKAKIFFFLFSLFFSLSFYGQDVRLLEDFDGNGLVGLYGDNTNNKTQFFFQSVNGRFSTGSSGPILYSAFDGNDRFLCRLLLRHTGSSISLTEQEFLKDATSWSNDFLYLFSDIIVNGSLTVEGSRTVYNFNNECWF